ncbi:MAG: hypothetical protein R2706_08225 [Acidimicrobiales bacterium]
MNDPEPKQTVPRRSAIHIGPGARLAMKAVRIGAGRGAGAGLVGDRYPGTKTDGATIQSQASLDCAARHCTSAIATRRNITISDGLCRRSRDSGWLW